MIGVLIDFLVLAFLVVIAYAVVRLHNLFAVVMLTGIYSLQAALLFVVLDAVDVAFTEAAVGAGISTVLMLMTLGIVGHESSRARKPPYLALAVVLVTGAALILATVDMPQLASPDAPAHLHVAPRYIYESPKEIGIPNMVTSVLASYRGYDTLGETVVIFTAGVGVLLLLSGMAPRGGHQTMRQYIVLRIISKLSIPLILMFALYVQFHGDFGPGGGFQAGVILAAAFILYALVFGLHAARAVAPPGVLHAMSAVGVLLYGGVGVFSLLLGDAFLDYDGFAKVPQAGQHLGILLVELGVGITVCSVMLTLFFAFAAWERDR